MLSVIANFIKDKVINKVKDKFNAVKEKGVKNTLKNLAKKGIDNTKKLGFDGIIAKVTAVLPILEFAGNFLKKPPKFDKQYTEDEVKKSSEDINKAKDKTSELFSKVQKRCSTAPTSVSIESLPAAPKFKNVEYSNQDFVNLDNRITESVSTMTSQSNVLNTNIESISDYLSDSNKAILDSQSILETQISSLVDTINTDTNIIDENLLKAQETILEGTNEITKSSPINKILSPLYKIFKMLLPFLTGAGLASLLKGGFNSLASGIKGLLNIKNVDFKQASKIRDSAAAYTGEIGKMIGNGIGLLENLLIQPVVHGLRKHFPNFMSDYNDGDIGKAVVDFVNSIGKKKAPTTKSAAKEATKELKGELTDKANEAAGTKSTHKSGLTGFFGNLDDVDLNEVDLDKLSSYFGVNLANKDEVDKNELLQRFLELKDTQNKAEVEKWQKELDKERNKDKKKQNSKKILELESKLANNKSSREILDLRVQRNENEKLAANAMSSYKSLKGKEQHIATKDLITKYGNDGIDLAELLSNTSELNKEIDNKSLSDTEVANVIKLLADRYGKDFNNAYDWTLEDLQSAGIITNDLKTIASNLRNLVIPGTPLYESVFEQLHGKKKDKDKIKIRAEDTTKFKATAEVMKDSASSEVKDLLNKALDSIDGVNKNIDSKLSDSASSVTSTNTNNKTIVNNITQPIVYIKDTGGSEVSFDAERAR